MSTETLPAQRGTITDRNGVDLAVSEPAQEISADPYLIKEPLQASQQLAPLLGLTQTQLLSKLSEHTGFVVLAPALAARQARKVMARVTALKLEGITGTPTMRRVYPRGTLAAQVLGFVGAEGKGSSGLEYSQEALLQGRAGERKVVSDAIGQPISITSVHAEQPGAKLTLTLDANIQQRAEDVLDAVGKVFDPKDATAIVMNPKTGALLAVANWPQVDLNDPGAYSKPALEAAAQDRAVSFNYEPGSTFKVVAVSGGLESGLITPDTPFDIPDQIQVADRTIHDAEEHPDETLTVSRNPRPIEQRRGDPDRRARRRREVQRMGAQIRVRRPYRRGTAGRGNGRGAGAERILGLLDGEPADRPGRAGDAAADGQRRTRRSPTAGCCARRTSSARSMTRPSPSRRVTA